VPSAIGLFTVLTLMYWKRSDRCEQNHNLAMPPIPHVICSHWLQKHVVIYSIDRSRLE